MKDMLISNDIQHIQSVVDNSVKNSNEVHSIYPGSTIGTKQAWAWLKRLSKEKDLIDGNFFVIILEKEKIVQFSNGSIITIDGRKVVEVKGVS